MVIPPINQLVLNLNNFHYLNLVLWWNFPTLPQFSHIFPSFPLSSHIFLYLFLWRNASPWLERSDLVRILCVAAEGHDATSPRLHGRGWGRAVSLEDELAAVEVLEGVARRRKYGKIWLKYGDVRPANWSNWMEMHEKWMEVRGNGLEIEVRGHGWEMEAIGHGMKWMEIRGNGWKWMNKYI